MNLGLFINDKIGKLAFESLEKANEINSYYREMSQYRYQRGKKNIQRLNRDLTELRYKFNMLVDLTKGHFKKTCAGDKHINQLVTMCLTYNNKPINEIKPLKYSSLVKQYFELLNIKGVIPITAGYSDSTGVGAFMSD